MAIALSLFGEDAQEISVSSARFRSTEEWKSMKVGEVTRRAARSNSRDDRVARERRFIGMKSEGGLGKGSLDSVFERA